MNTRETDSAAPVHMSNVSYAGRWVLALIIASLVGIVASQDIRILGILAAIPLLAMLVVSVKKYRGRFFLMALMITLLGYMIAGKGFAYLGIPPIFVSELVLGLGCFSVLLLLLLRGRVYAQMGVRLDVIFLLLFVLWGAICTIPFWPQYGLNALRDGVVWGYAGFAVCIALIVSRNDLDWLLGWYRRLLPYILVWLAVSKPLARLITFPSVPGYSSVSIIDLKGGDVGVHLAGIAAFILLRLDRYYGPRFSATSLWLMWGLWSVTWVFYGAANRGGMWSALLGIVIVLLWRINRVGWLRPVTLLVFVLSALLLFDLFGIQLSSEQARRQVSVEQIVTGFTSTFGGRARPDQLSNRAWRLEWWKDIADYTFRGNYFWKGKGYGVNLAVADGRPGIVTADGAQNRHPHNITMNILARSGVVGLALWLLFLFSLAIRFIPHIRRKGYERDLALWFLAYWVAFLFNASFDVFLEGPMGGVWFWSLIGMMWIYLHRASPAHRTGASAV